MMPPFVPLSDVLTVGRQADCPVSLHNGATHFWGEFSGRVAAVASRLGGAGEARWVLFTDDAWAFAIGLLGIWHAGGIAVVPPNGQLGTLNEVGAAVRGVITDRPEGVVGAETISVLDAGTRPLQRWPRLDPERMRLELYTSGTTRDHRAVVKALGDLDREVATHEARWGRLLDGAQAVATVSHQHIYGLLFRIVWPLAVARVFRGDALLHPGEVAAALVDARSSYLISTPAHLRRFEKSESSLELLNSGCRVVFSSGGPLDSETAHALGRAAGSPPIEVFGSTETGGVAWRRQSVGEPPVWTPFDTVTVTLTDDGCLCVESPWTGAPGGRVTMGDRGELHPDGSLTLGTRADRILKVGEKRIALPEMEARLAEHPFVQAVALTGIRRRGEMRLGAVVVPSQQGALALKRNGPRGFANLLRQWLNPHWDRVVLPRAWRFVEDLPEDAQGKTSVAALHALFAPPSER